MTITRAVLLAAVFAVLTVFGTRSLGQQARYAVNGGTASCTSTPSLYRVSNSDTGFGIDTTGASTGPCIAVDGVLAAKFGTTRQQLGTFVGIGGLTSGFPALKRSGAGLVAVLGDDSANANFTAAAGIFSTNIVNGTSGRLYISASTPTIASGFGTSATVAASNGTPAFRVNVGTGGSATSGVIGLPTASTGWNCFATDVTTPGANATKQSASTTTSVTLTNYNTTTGMAAAWTASDILAVSCFGY